MGFLSGFVGPAAAHPKPFGAPNANAAGQDMARGRLTTAGLGLDFVSAVRAHRAWKMELSKRLRTLTAPRLDDKLIAQDNRSVLGQWLHGEALHRFGHLPSFAQLRHVHALFHQAAARAVQLHYGGQAAEADQLLRQGEYPRHSLKIMGLLGALHDEAARDALVTRRPWTAAGAAAGAPTRGRSQPGAGWRAA